MTLIIGYDDRSGAFEIDLAGSVRPESISVTCSAQLGQIGQGSIEFDDPSGNLGHSGDQILGLKILYLKETAAPALNQRIFSGYIHDREYTAEQSLLTGTAVKIKASLADLNDESRYYNITGSDGNRPAETVGARLTWLLSTSYVSMYDTGYVVYPSTSMPANDYRNQTGADVLDDCAQTVGYNWFLILQESTGHAGLFFDDPNGSTAYASTLRVSTVLSDVDSSLTLGDGATHTWASTAPAVLKRSPNNVYSRISLAWAKGTNYGNRVSTATKFGRIDSTTADTRITTSAAADARIARLLYQASTEEDVITCQIQVPAANVNDLREGHRMSARFRNLPGYTSFSWFRVLERTIHATPTPTIYTIDLTLSPQEATGATIVQTATNGSFGLNLTFAQNNQIGNVLLCLTSWRELTALSYTGPCPDGETWTLLDREQFHRDGTPDALCGVSAYVTTVTIAQSVHPVPLASGGLSNGRAIHSVMYELSGVNAVDLTAIGIGTQVGTDMNIGSLGTLRSGQVAFGVWANGFDGFSNQTISHSATWVYDWMASRDRDPTNTSYWNSTSTAQTLYGEGFCFGWYGHLLGSGSSVSADVTVDSSHKWGGIAVTTP